MNIHQLNAALGGLGVALPRVKPKEPPVNHRLPENLQAEVIAKAEAKRQRRAEKRQGENHEQN